MVHPGRGLQRAASALRPLPPGRRRAHRAASRGWQRVALEAIAGAGAAAPRPFPAARLRALQSAGLKLVTLP